MACSGCEHQLMTYLPRFSGKEDEIIEFLIQHGVLRSAVSCELCGNEATITKLGKGYYFSCGRKHKNIPCRFQKAIRKDTFVGNSDLPIEKLMNFCLLWLLHPYPRQRVMMEELHFPINTAVEWSMFMHEVCINWLIKNSRKIGGKNKVVEMDESKFGSRKLNTERIVVGQWVFGGVERGDKSHFFLVPVKQRNQENLLQLIRDWILPGTIIISSCWKNEDTLDNKDFTHLQAHDSIAFVPTGKSGYIYMENLRQMGRIGIPWHTTSVENQCKTVKYSIPGFGKKKEHFSGYLAEYIFKQIHPRKARMHHFLMAAADLYPPPE